MKLKLYIMLTLALVFVVYLVPSVTALTFDNRLKSYDELTQTIIIDDNFGLGGDLVKVQLLDNTYFCGVECSAIWNVTIYKDDDNFLSSIEFKQIVGGRGVSSSKYEVITGYNEITVQDYVKDCSVKDSLGICASVKSGTHTEQVPIWNTFNPSRKLPIGNYIIKLTGQKAWGDTIDWIPTFYGKKITLWAFWASVDPVAAWEFNETSGSHIVDSTGIHNMSFSVADIQFVPGKLANAINLSSGGAKVVNTTGSSDWAFGTGDFTVCMWINETIGSSSHQIIGNDPVNGWRVSLQTDQGALTFDADGVNKLITGPGVIQTGNFTRACYVREGTGANQFKFYVNANNTINGTLNTDITDSSTQLDIAETQISSGYKLDNLQIYKGFAFTVSDIIFDYNNGVGRNAQDSSVDVSTILTTLLLPINNTLSIDTSLNFSASVVTEFLNLTNSTFRLYNTTTNLFNISNQSMDSAISNSTEFIIPNLIRGTYFWNIEVCGITDNSTASTLCDVGNSNFTFTIASSTIASSFSDFTYETSTETFQENVTLLEGDIISSVDFIYNGTSNSATSTLISGNNYTLQSTIDIPISAVGQNTTQWFFSMNLNIGQDNLSLHNQSVGVINLSIFGQGIGGLPYINFTFQNETVAQESVSSTFASTWTYYLGSGTVNKTLSFTNASENFNYSFQFHPQNRTLFADMTTDYTNSESQQRTFNPTLFTLTNSTSLQTLLLLPTSDGLFQQFVTQTLVGNTIADVNFVINRSISGISTEISSGATDGSGFASIFLNPDFSYTALFTKVGFNENGFSFQPSNQLRTVIMGSSIPAANGSTISRNTNISIFPVNTTLNNGTDFLFAFNVSSTQPINLITMNITNLSGFQVGFQTNAGPGFISQTINTGENSTFIGTFTYSTGIGNETITFNKVWQISLNFEGDYSIFRQFSLYTTYGFEDFLRLMIVIFFIIAVLIFMTTGEVIDTSESKLAVALLLIWAFSIVGWLNTGVPVTDAGGLVILSQFSNQYGIAIITTGVGVFFIGRRIFT